MKIRGSRGNWTRLGFPSIFLLCVFFFFAGFFGQSLFSLKEITDDLRPRWRGLEQQNEIEFEAQARGESGEDSVASIPFQILSWNPRTLYFPKFANAQQCEAIIKMAKVKLKPSKLALREGETAENTKGVRTSSGMFISSDEDETGILDQVEAKIARATMVPKNHGESFNILRYEIGQRYQSHYDAFNPAEYGPQESQRVATFLLYLSDVEKGGETMFPYENGQNMDGNYDYSKCIGLKVKPHMGDGILFYSVLPNGTINPMSLHGSCPVIKGEKWVATKWIRDREQFDKFS